MTYHVYVQPGETISQALSRACLDLLPASTLPPGLAIHGDQLKQATIVDRRKTGIPFLPTQLQP